ncbi:tripartite tricarboxylate transporter substrate binding protein [Ramlibacter sp. Leaf400]|uniref:tripartite tricarboxylate transporter substrate binding protein n=1 Tax=Ramlibacter sp. Leaf400 TaxID=1736365 RepID=UPI0006FDE0F3|nr:tripartite tricarboxylate transporter substrate binding protein [Ramlibacter sp. Leaf400]KQT13158.1 LacI family transcriptional regulator [Ramlibacter sp. Leaf400]
MKTSFLPKLAGALALAGAAFGAAAQDWQPAKPIRMVIPSTPGGGTDFIGRTISTKLAEATGWQVVPDNRPGAAGTLGLSETARARPEGYELVIGQTANVALAPWLMKLSFDPAKDLTPIASAVEAPMVLLVNEASPYKTWADFVNAAKASGKPLSFATSGTGSVAHVAGVMLQEVAGFKLQHVPYKGSTPAIADLVGGHVDLAGTSVASALSLVQGGKVRALAVTSGKRSQVMPNVPALAELGYPRFHMVEWYGVFAPPNLPPAIADRFNAEINKVLQKPEVRNAIVAQGQEPRVDSRAAFAAMVKGDNQQSKDIIGRAGIRVE